MSRVKRAPSGFRLIELLVVIAVIAIPAALLFPGFAVMRGRARMTACVSNMRQIGSALMMYAQDYDETFPYIRLHQRDYVWRNAIQPYVKNSGVFACPSNPISRSCPPDPARKSDPKGICAEGWMDEATHSMAISYAMNSCAST